MVKNNGRKILLAILSIIVIGMIFIPAPNALAVEFDDVEIDGIKESYYQEIEVHDNYTVYACESDDIMFIYIDFVNNISEGSILLQSGSNEYNLTTAMDTSFLKSIKTDFILEFSIVNEVISNEQIILVIEGLETNIIIGPSSEDITIPGGDEPDDRDETKGGGEGYNIFTLIRDIRDNIPWWFWVISTFFGTITLMSPALISWRLKEHPIQVFDVLTGTPQKRDHKKAGRWIREERSKIRNYMAHIYNSGSDGVTTIFSEDNQSTIRGNEWMNILRVIRLYPDYHLTERKLTIAEQYDSIYIEQNKRCKYWYRIMRHIPNKTIAMNSNNKLKRYRIAVCPICKNQVKLYIKKVEKKVKETGVKIDTLKSRTPYLDGINETNPVMICENEECESRKQKNKEPEKIEHIIEKVDSIMFLELKITMDKVTTLCDVEYTKKVTEDKLGKIETPMSPKAIPITTYLTLKNEDDSVVKDSLKITGADFITTKHKSIVEAYKEQASMTEGRNIKAIELAYAYEAVEKLSNECSELSDTLIQQRAKFKRNAMNNMLALSRDFTDIIDLNKFGHIIFRGKALGLSPNNAIAEAIKELTEVPIKDDSEDMGMLRKQLKKSEESRKQLEADNLNKPFTRQKRRFDPLE